MKVFAENTWNDLPFSDYRGRFFIETFWELLSNETPHFYHSRLMNTISCTEELIESINLYEESEKYIANLQNSVRELKSALNSDSVTQNFYQIEVALLNRLLDELLHNNISKTSIDKAYSCCKVILNKKSGYFSAIEEELRQALIGEVDLDKTDRNLKRLHSITSIYVSNMLSRGYSPTYLYNRMDYFTRTNNYGQRNFLEQFNSMISKVNGRKRNYKVYFALHSNKKTTLLTNEHLHKVEFAENVPQPLADKAAEVFNERLNLYAVVEVNATDYVSASWLAKDEFDKCLDYLYTKINKLNINVSKNSLSIYKSGGNTFKQSTNVDLLIRFLSHDQHNKIDSHDIEKKVSKVLTNKAFDQLSRSLRYLRLGKESVSLEQKLLNTWIALESLFADSSGKNIIQKIVDFVPKAYAYESIQQRSNYLLKRLIKNRVNITAIFKETLETESDTFDRSICHDKFITALKNEPATIELFNSLGKKEQLKYRLKIIHGEIKDIESVKKRLNKTEEDVIRQLRRLYLYRNKIAHLGHISGIRPQLVNHLVEYLIVCFKAIFATIDACEETNTLALNEALVSFSLGMDVVDHLIKNNDGSITNSSIKIQPVI